MERRPVTWILAIPVEVMCEYTGVPQGEYYTDRPILGLVDTLA